MRCQQRPRGIRFWELDFEFGAGGRGIGESAEGEDGGFEGRDGGDEGADDLLVLLFHAVDAASEGRDFGLFKGLRVRTSVMEEELKVNLLSGCRKRMATAEARGC